MSLTFVRCSSRTWLALIIACLSILRPSTLRAATAGELLEKAIYTEETVGNLDEAIELYRQVVSAAAEARHAAAQAQFRLGLCFQKQGKLDEAAAAFQAVVDQFPQEAVWVAEAKKHLPRRPALAPFPWQSGERLYLNMKLATGLEVGTMIYMVDAVSHQGREVWQCSTRGLATVNGVNTVSQVWCDKESFAPLESFWRHSLLGEATAMYGADQAEITVRGKQDPLTVPLDTTVWDNEQATELFRLLPQQVGYKTDLTVLSSLGGSTVKLALHVADKQTIEVPAGKFECIKLVLDIGQTFWISTDEHRYLVRFEAGGVVAELARIEHQTRDAPLEVSGAGLKLTLPSGWLAYAPVSTPDDAVRKILLLDPQAVAITEVTVGRRSRLKEEQQASPQAWTESYVKDAKERIRDFAVREPGIFATTVAGQEAAVLIADHQTGGKPLTVYGAALFSNESAVNLRMSAAAEHFDTLRGAVESILSSMKVE
jgi:hypothetical protein